MMRPFSKSLIGQQRAFTLIEMLVVLIIVSLIVTVVMQGFGYTLGLYQRVVGAQKVAYEQVLSYQWFTRSLQAQVAKRPKDRSLEGSNVELSTYSFRPLIGPQGLKTMIAWELQSTSEGLALRYKEHEISFIVQRWPQAIGKFEYLDDEGNWQETWPVKESAESPLPDAIRLVVSVGGDTLNYVAKVATRRVANVTLEESIYGRE
jgi:general secretion pathway protein J